MHATIQPGFLLLLAAAATAAETRHLNGFLIDEPLVPAQSIERGGPPRDGIPAIDAPRFTAAGAAKHLKSDDRVLGISLEGSSKAYPIAILNWHEVVNDTIDGQPIVVTYCPLCGSGIAFSARVDDKPLTFGVSGLLYNSDVLLYDRQTESLWSQISSKAINGPLKGKSLTALPLRQTTWEDWRERHPDTVVLSRDTGHRVIDYDRDPYEQYRRSGQLWFAVENSDGRLRRKEWVLGVVVGDAAKAYPLRRLRGREPTIEDRIGGRSVRIEFDKDHHTAVAYGADGEQLPAVQLFWFAWAAFHPDTEIWSGD